MSPTRPTRLLLFAALAAFSGCACEDVPDGALTRCEDALVVPGVVKTDILFVIDDSGSMDQEQQNLKDNLYAFIQALDAAPIANEFQIGVTTSAVEGYGTNPTQAYASGVPYPDGALVAVGRTGAGVPVPGQLIWSSGAGFGGTRVLSADSSTLVPDFQANVLVGTSGSGKEQPFRAARLALSDRIADGTNAGFLREPADPRLHRGLRVVPPWRARRRAARRHGRRHRGGRPGDARARFRDEQWVPDGLRRQYLVEEKRVTDQISAWPELTTASPGHMTVATFNVAPATITAALGRAPNNVGRSSKRRRCK